MEQPKLSREIHRSSLWQESGLLGRLHRVCKLLSLAVVAVACSGQSTEERTALEQRRLERQEREQAAVEQLIQRFDPDTSWDDELGDAEGLRGVFTIELQERLADISRPILFRGVLIDAARTPNATVAVFRSPWMILLDPIYFHLQVSEDQLDSLLKASRSSYVPEFAVVTNVAKVERLPFSVDAASEDRSTGTLYLEPESSRLFLAEGELLGFRFLE